MREYLQVLEFVKLKMLQSGRSMEILDSLGLGFLSELFSESGKASLAEKLMIVGVVWFSMGRKVAGHFSSLESGMKDGFERLTNSINEVRQALSAVENNHAKRIELLSHSVKVLDSRIVRLEDYRDKKKD
jgi:preprotein translocase subunit SecG